MSNNQRPEAPRLASEYRKTMPADVLHLWACDVVGEQLQPTEEHQKK